MQIEKNYPLKSINTFGIAAQAKYFTSFDSLEVLQEIVQSAYFKSCKNSLILGGGSNILFTQDFDGIVLKNELKGKQLTQEDDQFYYVTSAAGETWHNFVLYCIDKGFAGLENLSLIPGCVGASPIQNIGAYGIEIKDVFYSLTALHIPTGNVVDFSLNDCNFGYRDSVFKHHCKGEYVILSVTYQLPKVPKFNTSYGAIMQTLESMGITELSSKAISDAVIAIRSSKLPNPAEVGNAGSFFKNPQINISQYNQLLANYPKIPMFKVNDTTCKIPAAWLIEQTGWKGFRKGDAGCNPLQPLVLVNYGEAKGSEIVSLAYDIIASVSQKFHITLECEVNII